MIDKDYMIDTLQKLVQINSVNPALEKGGGGEAEIGQFIFHELQNHGVDVALDEIEEGRVNVTGRIRGSGDGKSLMLNAHMDTVGVAGMLNPFAGEIKDGKLYGRGAYDMKGSIAAMLGVAKSLKENSGILNRDLFLSFVADEEYESVGAEALAKKVWADEVIVAEPTDLKICTAHRGFGIWKMSVTGKTAHGGNHHLGVDANMHMGLLMAELYSLAIEVQKEVLHPLCGPASMHVPLVSGGRSLFIYSNHCEIQVERRTVPGESREEIESELEGIIQKLNRSIPEFKAKLELVIWRSPYEIDSERPIVQKLHRSVESVLKAEPEYIGHTWWEDSAIFGKAGMETVIIGPKGGGIHEEVEWVELESVFDLCEIFLKTAGD